MQDEEVLQECLAIHRQLLEMEQGIHRWLNELTGFENEPANQGS